MTKAFRCSDLKAFSMPPAFKKPAHAPGSGRGSERAFLKLSNQ
jgi:hypothetical protein